MIKVEDSIIVQRPIEEVFAFLADQTNAPRWQSGLLEVRRTTEGPIGVGTKHTAVRKFMGRRVEASNEFVEYEQNRIIAFTGKATGIDFAASYTTESTPEGTKVISYLEMQPKGFFGFTEPLMTSSLRREMAANLGELKQVLESEVAAVTA
jgi:uncharacterized protein YndB with AHSA1/START domain